VLFNDGLLNAETTTYADNTPRTVTYTNDSDSDRATIQYPNNAYSFTYNYTGRNQLQDLINTATNANLAHYVYDPDGNLTTRTPDNSTSSSFGYDALDRVTHIAHALNGTTRTFDYAYDSVSNRKWSKRDGGSGDVFGYDLNDQSISVLLNVANPDTTSPGPQTIVYDANGNRTSFSAYGATDTYTIDNNSLNQYHTRNSATASYDSKGNMTTGFDGSTYSYDAQNRLLTAARPGANPTIFSYDALNRMVKRVNSRTVTPFSAVSRKTHGAAGTFDTNLPLTGNAGIECRSGGASNAHQIVLSFAGPVTFASAAVTSGTGTLASTSTNGAQITVNLTGVTNAQTIVVTLFGVSDGTVTNNVAIAMGVLVGDTNADGFVDSADVTQVQSQSGAPVTASNCREDLNVDGFIDSADKAFAQSKSGTALPSSPPLNAPSPVNYLVYDGWNLIAEYQDNNQLSGAYLSGATGLIKNLLSSNYYYQDASGSTSHLADSVGTLLEWYRYDLHGTPLFYDSLNNQLSASNYSVRHLFTGQQWYSDLGLYDLRNRFYSPDIGRFLQPDPISFAGDPSHLYRYARNNPFKGADPTGLDTYLGYRWLSILGGQATTSTDVYSHGFVFTTDSYRNVTDTYGWGETSFRGTWAGGYDTQLDWNAATVLSSSGGAIRVGGSDLDPYVDKAYRLFVSQEGKGNFNLLLLNNCDAAALSLIWVAGGLEYLANNDPGVRYGFYFGPDNGYGYWDDNGNGYYMYGSPQGEIIGWTNTGEAIYSSAPVSASYGAGFVGWGGWGSGFNGYGGLGGFAGPNFGNWGGGSGGGDGGETGGCGPSDPDCKKEK
jgi:RHS repeat-associated protein